jgi:hypothetical protein
MARLGVRTEALSRFVLRGQLKSDGPQGKVCFGLQQRALRLSFPQLWPDAEMVER